MQVLAALFDSMASAGSAQQDGPVESAPQEGPPAKRQRCSNGHEPAAAGRQRMRLETPFNTYSARVVTSFLQMVYDSSSISATVHTRLLKYGESSEVGRQPGWRAGWLAGDEQQAAQGSGVCCACSTEAALPRHVLCGPLNCQLATLVAAARISAGSASLLPSLPSALCSSSSCATSWMRGPF